MMFQRLMRFTALFSVVALVAIGCSTDAPTTTSDDDGTDMHRSGELIPGQYIIVFDDDAIVQKGETLQDFTHAERIDRVRNLTVTIASEINIPANNIIATWGSALRGAVLNDLSPNDVEQLRNDRRIKHIEQDYWITLPPFDVQRGKPDKGNGGGEQAAQTTPWGIEKVGGAVDASSSTVTAWIVDTGIDTDHPDLNVNKNKGKDFTRTGRRASVEDGNGHGTHTAGTVGAIDNEIGVIGVAAGITLVPMKVLSDNGSGQFSWSISAFDHIASKGTSGDVVNYSVGPGSRYTSTTLDNAVKGMASAGIKVCMAAGNSNDDCSYYSPARVNATNLYTIAAMTSSSAKASYSNYGSPVDYWEPGSGVYSTYKNGGYATASGTSMASPHACGILAVGGITSGGSVSGVPAGTTTDWGKRN
jgi:hypothetical protein